MIALQKTYQRLLQDTEMEHFRYLYDNIRWSNRLIGIVGARGTGKTTLILQYIKQHFPERDKALYASLDNVWFATHTLSELAEQFYNYGGTHLFLDEVHRYNGWAVEIKNIYDSYPKIHIVFTGSSLLEIYRQKVDLSRRVVLHHLQGLSFREFLSFENKLKIAPVSLNDILTNHQQIAADVCQQIKILPEFYNYLSYGYYPFYKESVEDYHFKVQSIINLILDGDLPTVENIGYLTIQKIKKLLIIISNLTPYTPNIARLSNDIESNRKSTLIYLSYLQKAALLQMLSCSQKNMGAMSKPEKIYLENSNLLYALSEAANIDNVRETFFANQLRAKYAIDTVEQGDFKVADKYIFEIAGKSKTYEQIKNIENSYIASDDLEIGFGNKIPLWLFGFLY
jgi:predicted AAA+ superfamily ATPase